MLCWKGIGDPGEGGCQVSTHKKKKKKLPDAG